MTEDEAIEKIMRAARFSASYWINDVSPDNSCEKRITGAIFTFLAELDGCGGMLPSVDLVVLNEDQEVRVSTMLHEYFYQGWNPNV